MGLGYFLRGEPIAIGDETYQEGSRLEVTLPNNKRGHEGTFNTYTGTLTKRKEFPGCTLLATSRGTYVLIPTDGTATISKLG